ncbi:hypothetical protein [Waltera sp.]|uniref:hypothetical protein n=1 Tax=Waltera sp. TaxID=2815806 RepID=UPI003AB71F29
MEQGNTLEEALTEILKKEVIFFQGKEFHGLTELSCYYGQDVVEKLAREQSVSLQIPEELLQDAGISMDADLDIVCQNGRIVISSSELLKKMEIPEEVMEICNELGISEDKVKIILNTTEGESDEKTGT